MSAERRQARSKESTDRALDAALHLFSNHGFGATSMRQIAERSGLSIGNLYHHFPNKDAIFQQLIQDYWSRLRDPEHPLQQLFARANFPEDLEEMAELIEKIVEENPEYILLFYVDVIEFRGDHIRSIYEGMARNFKKIYGDKLEARKQAGEFGDIDPLVGVMAATRWFFYFFTVETCFGMPGHFGMDPKTATAEFIQLIRHGLLPRFGGDSQQGEPVTGEDA